MRLQANGARTARPTACTSPRPIRRGNPGSRTCRARSRPQERAATRRGRATRRTSPLVRAREVPLRLRARAGRALPSLPPRSRTEALATRPFTAMLRRTPIPASSTTRLEPPYETNGRGIPVSGAIPSAAARSTAACPETSAVMPAASSFPNGSWHRMAMRNPATASSANAQITTVAPISPAPRR